MTAPKVGRKPAAETNRTSPKPGVYLPKLPDDWAYGITAERRDGTASVAIDQAGHRVQLKSETFSPTPIVTASLAEAVKAAAALTQRYEALVGMFPAPGKTEGSGTA